MVSLVRVGRAVVLLLGVIFLAGGLQQAWTDSPTVDEGIDLASGLSHWVHHDLRMNPEHPPLPKLLAVAPALAADPIVPKGPSWSDGDWFEHADDVMRANDEAGRLRRVLFLSRLVPLAEVLACAVLIYGLARRFGGEGAGLVAAGAWLTTPVVLGLGHVQSIDVAFTLTTLGLVAALVRHRDRPTLRSAALVGVLLAVGLATRHTGIVLVPVALLVVAVVAPREDRARHGGLAALVGWAGLWVVYRGFDLTSPGGDPAARFEGMIGAAGNRSALARVALLVPAPEEWRAGLAWLTLTSDPRPAWLFGQAWEGSQPWFFPGSLVASAPVLVLAVLVLGTVGWVAADRARQRDVGLLVALPGLVLFGFTAVQPLNLGLRLALPSLALWLVVAAAGLAVGAHRLLDDRPALARPARAGLAVAAVVQAVVLVTASGHALAWRPVAFRPGHRFVSDANLDFGQDLWRLRDWAEDHDRPFVSVIRPRGLEPGPATRDLLDADPDEVTGWVAVGATALTVVSRDELSWLRAYCPVGTLGGGSTLLYRFAEPPSREAGPTRPVAPCDGDAFSSRR